MSNENDMTYLFDKYPKSILDRFKKFHQENPNVYREFKRLALKIKATGRKKYSARTIIEVMRWHFDLKTTGNVFEINGDFVPILARVLIYNMPDFENFFELRTVRSQDLKSSDERSREIRPKRGDKTTMVNGC